MTQNAKVKVLCFTELFTSVALPIALDVYQRPYVRGPDKVKQLLEDLKQHFRQQRAVPDYYLGSILLHESRQQKKLFIIDGQQRLTSLAVLYHTCTRRLPPKLKLAYGSPDSARNIKQTQAECASVRESFTADTFQRISFTVITVTEEDLAFTFFDTQNNRGMPLNATDLLKAYHLRAITGDSRDDLQTECAKRWERLQLGGQKFRCATDFAPVLFQQYLWRARRWTGQKKLARETHNAIMTEFQHTAVTPDAPERLTLYPSRINSRHACLVLDLERPVGYRLTPNLVQKKHSSAQLPFVIRQPISKGIGFFLYADKYYALTTELMDPHSEDPAVLDFLDFYQKVIAKLSIYLRELFLLASVMFIDKFGKRQLPQFALWLDYSLGAIRLQKQYIFREAPLIYLRDSSHNLLDVIAGAFLPNQVIEFLRQDESAGEVYATERIEAGIGVQGAYKQRVLDYYGKRDSLKHKALWIEEKRP